MASSSFAATPSCLLTDRERVIGELTRGCVFADKLRLVLRGAAVDGGTSANDLLGRIVHTFTKSISMLCACSDSDEVYQVPAVVNSPVLKTEDSRESCKSPASKDRRGCYKRMNLQIKKQDKKRYVVSIRGIDLSIKKEIFTGGVNEDGVEIPTCTIDLDDEETDTESVDVVGNDVQDIVGDDVAGGDEGTDSEDMDDGVQDIVGDDVAGSDEGTDSEDMDGVGYVFSDSPEFDMMLTDLDMSNSELDNDGGDDDFDGGLSDYETDADDLGMSVDGSTDSDGGHFSEESFEVDESSMDTHDYESDSDNSSIHEVLEIGNAEKNENGDEPFFELLISSSHHILDSLPIPGYFWRESIPEALRKPGIAFLIMGTNTAVVDVETLANQVAAMDNVEKFLKDNKLDVGVRVRFTFIDGGLIIFRVNIV